jgi:hypothetical protein
MHLEEDACAELPRFSIGALSEFRSENPEKSKSARTVGSCALLGALAVAASWARSSNQARDFDVEIRMAVASAKQAAGFDFQGALVRTCLQPPQIGAANTNDTVPGSIRHD